MPKIKVALLLGGDSSEREISWKTGRSMHGALSPDKFEVAIFDVTSTHLSAGPRDPALDASRLDGAELRGLEEWWQAVRVSCNAKRVSWQELGKALEQAQADVALPALHGGWGEDGTLQTLLQVGGIPFAGSPTRSCLLAQDKALAKAVVRDLGIESARGWLLNDPLQAPPLPGKCVIKPNKGGSSVGVTILEDTAEPAVWQASLKNALAEGGPVLVEEFIGGTEITCAVLGKGANARVLPLIEIVPESVYYDFHSKYAEGGAKHLIPPRLGAQTLSLVEDMALRVHRAFGCGGVARSDWIVDENGRPYFLEMNTLPGMTRTSLVPDAARAAGIAFENLLKQLIEEALK